jgi:hypothetical protein
VSFPAQGGGTVNADVISISLDRLIVQTPANAASGNITLSTSDGQSSTIPFQVSSDPFGRALPAIPGVQALLNAVKKPVDGATAKAEKKLAGKRAKAAPKPAKRRFVRPAKAGAKQRASANGTSLRTRPPATGADVARTLPPLLARR